MTPTVGVIDPADGPVPYGDPLTYQRGAEWLRACSRVEDRGCGRGYFATVLSFDQRYVGIDIGVDSVPGRNPFATIQTQLEHYRSVTPGIFMRHVLEHNYTWRSILLSAVASFTERMALVVFTPLLDETAAGDDQVIALHGPPQYPYSPAVPNLSIKRSAIERHLVGCRWVFETLPTTSEYGAEHLWLIDKTDAGR